MYLAPRVISLAPWLVLAVALEIPLAAPRPAVALEVGFAEVDITPDVNGRQPVWIAGYGQNRRATGVHDPIMGRAVVLRDGQRKLALVCLDLVGLQYPEVLKIRAELKDFHYVMVSSSHNHEGPDVIGLWGPTPLASGVDPGYLKLVVRRSAELVRRAESAAAPARALYGTAEDKTGLLRDARLPLALDNVLRLVKFTRSDGDKPLGILVQWNCHPESIGPRNTLLSADFPATTVAALKQRHGCPIAYFTGAVGGLMTTPGGRYKDRAAGEIADDSFEYAAAYGEEVADLADRALAAAEPISLAPLDVAAAPIGFPLTNPLYHVARGAGVLPRQAHAWAGQFEPLGAVADAKQPANKVAIGTEVAYLRLGELHVACIPGELYPELVYGRFQEPVEPNVDFPTAALETPVMKSLPGPKALLIGLANDEVGYIIPKRQWDYAAPFAYGRKDRQYGEVNSCGPDAAPAILQGLVHRVQQLRDTAK